MQTKWLYRSGCLIILLVAWWLRVADLKDIPPGIYYDEGRIMQRVWRLTHGYSLPMYFQDEEEPTDAMIRAAFQEVAGGDVNMFILQMVSIWLNVLTVAVTIAAARTLYRTHLHKNVIALAAGMTLAVMPPAIMIGRHLYRSNWMPLLATMALIFLIGCWRTNRHRFFILMGVFTALPALFYLSGVFVPPAMLLAAASLVLLSRFRWPSWKNLFLAAIGYGVTMIPWIYFYLTIPNWLVRASDLIDQQSPLQNPSILLTNIIVSVRTLFVPDSIHDMRYNTFTTAFLNPALIVLFAIGLVVSLRRWKTPMFLVPLLIGVVFLLPNILSSEPFQPSRLVGMFVPLSLLVGLGSGEILKVLSNKAVTQRATQVALVGVFALSPVYTAYNIWYHFEVQPLLTNPTVPESFALKYRIGYQNLLQGIAASDQPTYLPVEYLNSDLAVDVLRPSSFPKALAYDGRPLPDGRVILPVNSIIYGFFILDHTPVQYALLIPKTGEIVYLPPLALADATALEQQTRNSGENVTNDQGWVLGQATPVTAENNPFQCVHIPPVQSLGLFDGNLELVGVDAPQTLTPGENTPITLYWRVREKTGKDYFSRLQVWDAQNMSEGYEHGSPLVKEPDFPLNILFYAYPTVMWQPGEIVADTRWIPVFKDAPAGGYRLAVGVYDYPGPKPVGEVSVAGFSQQQDHWLLTGRTAVGLQTFATNAPASQIVDADLGDSIRLTGYQTNVPLNALKPGDTLNVQLDWQDVQPIGDSYTLFLHLIDTSGNIVAQDDSLPFGGGFPTWAWIPGVSLSTHHTLAVPNGSQPPYALAVGMYSYPSLQRLPVKLGGVPAPDDLIKISAP